MEIRLIQDSDYEQYIVPFWNSWNSTPPPKDFLPDIGFIVFDKDIAVAAGYVYITNSKTCWIEWVCSDKNYTYRKNRKFALLLLLDTLTNICINGGYKYIFAVIKSDPLIKVYEKAGFVKGGTGTEMFKKINE